MRRAATKGPISPQLLKHFAVATIAVTGLLALFSSGSDLGATAQIRAINNGNQLARAEVAQFGAKRVAAKLQVRKEPAVQGFNDDAAIGLSGNNSGYAAPRRQTAQPVMASAELQIPQPQGASTATSSALVPDGLQGLPGGSAAKGKKPTARSNQNFEPNAQQIAALKERSAQRSASGSDGGH